MDGEITYADLALERKKCHRNQSSLPQPGASGCPQWHRTALWTGWTGNLLLGVAVVAMGCSLLHHRSENPGNCRNVSGNMSENIRDGNTTLEKVYSELREVFCSLKPQEDERCTLCPMNWTPHGTKCYWVSHELSHWNSSREDCVNRGGKLLMPRDQEELDFINRTLQKPTRYFWIGLFFENGWTWVNGSHLDRSRLQLNPLAERGSCGVIREDRISTISCSGTFQWICQKEATQL